MAIAQTLSVREAQECLLRATRQHVEASNRLREHELHTDALKLKLRHASEDYDKAQRELLAAVACEAEGARTGSGPGERR